MTLDEAKKELTDACTADAAAHAEANAIHKEMAELHDRALAARLKLHETDRAVMDARRKVVELTAEAASEQ